MIVILLIFIIRINEKRNKVRKKDILNVRIFNNKQKFVIVLITA